MAVRARPGHSASSRLCVLFTLQKSTWSTKPCSGLVGGYLAATREQSHRHRRGGLSQELAQQRTEAEERHGVPAASLGPQRADGAVQSESKGPEPGAPMSGQKRDVSAQQSASPCSCTCRSTQALRAVGGCPPSGAWSLLCPLIEMPTSSRNTLTDSPEIVCYQFPGCPSAEVTHKITHHNTQRSIIQP